MFSGRGNPPAASRHPPLTRGALREGDIRGASRLAFQEGTLIRLAFGQPPSPLKGEGLRAADSRPYGDIRMSQTSPREGQAPPLQLSRNSSGIG